MNTNYINNNTTTNNNRYPQQNRFDKPFENNKYKKLDYFTKE
jgi:hypothetical protein